MKAVWQRTLSAPVTFSGKGVHSGKLAKVVLRPAAAEYGIHFRRIDVTDRDNMIPALYDSVNDTQLGTRLTNDAGVEIYAVQILMAALAICGIDNVLIEVDGPEIPILDGSASKIVEKILEIGSSRQDAPVRYIKILETVEVNFGETTVKLEPSETLEFDITINFENEQIGYQRKSIVFDETSFQREIANSRQFVQMQDFEALSKVGLAQGAGLDNNIVVDDDQILNPEGLRYVDEFVRNKILTTLGNLNLAGAPIIGKFTGLKSGHRASNLVLRELFSKSGSWEMILPEVDSPDNTQEITEIEPILPSAKTAPIQVEVRDQVLKLIDRDFQLNDLEKAARAKQAWEILAGNISEFLLTVNVDNYRPLASSTSALQRALGDSFESMNEIAVGISGYRFKELAQDSEFTSTLPEGVKAELLAFSATISTFSLRFPQWIAYLDDVENTEITEVLIADTAKDILQISSVLDSASDVSDEVKSEFKKALSQIDTQILSRSETIGLLASTRELIRTLAEDLLMGWRLYQEQCIQAGHLVTRKAKKELFEMGKIIPNEIRKGVFWTSLTVSSDIFFLNGATLVSLANRFPNQLWWIKDVLTYLGVI